jgi:YidC/Oxa1 family membrane protein insertase
MNKNTVIGLVLVFAIMMGYMYLTQPSKEELQEKARLDSINRVKYQEQVYRDSLERVYQDSLKAITGVAPAATPSGTMPESQTGDTIQQNSGALTGPFGYAAAGEAQYYTLETDLLRIKLMNKGGRPVEVELKDYKTFDTLPLVLFREANSDFSIAFFSGRQRLHTHDYHFMPVWYDQKMQGTDSIVLNGETMKFGMRLYALPGGDTVPGNPFIEMQYTLTKGSYKVGFDVIFSHMQDYVAPQTEQLDLVWKTDLLEQEKTTNPMNGSTIYYAHPDLDVEFLSETKDDEMSVPTRIKWLSYKQSFFTSVLIAEDHFTRAEAAVLTNKKNLDPRYLRSMESTIGLPFRMDSVSTIPMSFYFGPNKFNTLKQYDLALERQIPLGWSFFLMQWINRGAVIPVFNWLEQFGWNYGIIILVLTLLLKLVLFPVAYKTYISSAKMRVLKPEVEEIGKKFPKKEDAMKKQQATMALYKSAGASPMAGCVPMLLQFPILLAMFRFFPASIELRQQSFLWAHDLSSYDSILDLGFEIPFYGDHVSLFTLLMTASTIIYTRMNNQMMSGTAQMPGMKLMMYLMPIMFLGIFNNYSSGLSYYYLLANLITFAQMYIMRQFVDEDKLRAKMQANKAKPVKKSKFQLRLEEAAKQKGYKPAKR